MHNKHPAPRKFLDQLGREVEILFPPQKIISLVPSQTELLATIGLSDRISGITKFCVHPEHLYRSKQRVGGTKTVKIEKIKEIGPDLIIANKEENEKGQIEELSKLFPVWISDIYTLTDALTMIYSVGQITGAEREAKEVAGKITEGFNSLKKLQRPLRCAYLIWKDPFISVGKNTFIDHMLQKCGFINVFSHLERYPEITLQNIEDAAPDIVLLSSEPYPFKEKHKADFEAIKTVQVELVDGEMFSWYGSRLLHAPQYLNAFLTRIC